MAAADFIPPLARPEVTAKRKPAGGEGRKEGLKNCPDPNPPRLHWMEEHRAVVYYCTRELGFNIMVAEFMLDLTSCIACCGTRPS